MSREGEQPNFNIKVEGKILGTNYFVRSITTERAFNRIGQATVLLDDGNPAKKDFAASGSADLELGKEIVIEAGPLSKPVKVFSGILVSQEIRVTRGRGQLKLVIKEKSTWLTLAKQNRLFLDQSESAAAKELLSEEGLSLEGGLGEKKREQVILWEQTAWEFLLMRARRLGMVMSCQGAKIEILKPNLNGKGKETLEFGKNLLNAQVLADGRYQLAGYEVNGWNYEMQSPVLCQGAEPSMSNQGAQSVGELTKVSGKTIYQLAHPAQVIEAQAQEWAEGYLSRWRRSKIQGWLTVPGTQSYVLGDLVEIKGMGKAFNGTALITGIRQESHEAAWSTAVQIGLSDQDLFAPAPAGNLIALQPGKVKAISNDPKGQGRVQVELPLFKAKPKPLVWARFSSLYASNGHGCQFFPYPGDEVTVGFSGGNEEEPIILGLLNSKNQPGPYPARDEKNALKGIKTQSGMELRFDDDQKILLLSTPAGNKFSLDESKSALCLEDQNGNQITLAEGGIEIKSAGNIILEANGNVSIKATGNISGNGAQVEFKANAMFKAQGTQTQIDGSATLTLKGGVVMIN